MRREGKDVVKLLQIRNPWGRGAEWTGEYSDADLESWSKIPAQDL